MCMGPLTWSNDTYTFDRRNHTQNVDNMENLYSLVDIELLDFSNEIK